jgi:hypothetical protein
MIRCLFQTTLDHPPTNKTLYSSETYQGQKRHFHSFCEISFVPKVTHRQGYTISDTIAKESMIIFNVEYLFKLIDSDVVICLLIFRSLFIPFKLLFPIILSLWVLVSKSLPSRHRKSTLCKSSVSS